MTGNDKTKKPGGPERRMFLKGTTIFKEGEAADAAYIVESGRVEVFKMIAGRRIPLGVIREWGMFGELGLVDDSPRMAGAFSLEDTVCLVVTQRSVSQMLDAAPPGLATVIESMAQTLRSAGEDLAQARYQLLEFTSPGS